MRYKIVISRGQTAGRHVGALSEQDAIRQVQAELERAVRVPRTLDHYRGWLAFGRPCG